VGAGASVRFLGVQVMTTPRVALFTWGVERGAFANIASALAKGFVDIGVEDLSIAYLGRETPAVEFPERARLVPLGVNKTMFSPPAVARFVRETRPDILISMPTMISVSAATGLRLSRETRTKLVIYQADTLTSDISIDHGRDPKMKMLPWLARRVYPHASGLASISEGVLEILEAARIPTPANRVRVIPAPVDLDGLNARIHGAPDHPWLRVSRVPNIVSLGRLVKRKNFPLLLECFAAVRTRLDARLIIFGEGPDRDRLEKLAHQLGIAEDFGLPGYSENPWKDIAKADVFVMSSVDESFCLALVEAMACGVPVVSTDAIGGGPRSILEHGIHGNLVPRDDAQALADVICDVLESPQRSEQLGEFSRRRSHAFSPQVIAGEWLSFLEEL
jgi:glycosyltransferase involved in cell wall biosynthesis